MMTETTMTAAGLVRRLWQYCNVLRDDGLSYPDYVEQLTYLLFLKMADEQQDDSVPHADGWSSFCNLDAEAMQVRYAEVLQRLGTEDGSLGVIFHNARNKIRDPAKLRLLVAELIGGIHWSGLSADLKGDAYEGLLEKNARDTKSGAGQYFTPRPLIEAIVECVDPQPGEVISDPACGTGGFLLAAHGHIKARNPGMSSQQVEHLRTRAIRGVELVEEVARLATMNLLLHDVSAETDRDLPIERADSLATPPKTRVDVVLTNPPFGVKGSVTYSKDGKARRTSDDLTAVRPDFWVSTANKQLNFVQHVISLLKPGGRAALVLPDNVLYEAGAGTGIRRYLVEKANLHTILRLPTGLFYAAGVKSNVLFLDNEPPSVDGILVYDFRSEGAYSLKSRPLVRSDLDGFVDLYKARTRGKLEGMPPSARWRSFDRSEILASEGCSLDLSWDDTQHDEQSVVEKMERISRQISTDLIAAMGHVDAIMAPR